MSQALRRKHEMAGELIEAGIGAGYAAKYWLPILGSSFLSFIGYHKWITGRQDKINDRLTAHELDSAAKIGAIQAKLEDIPHIRKRIDEVADHLINTRG